MTTTKILTILSFMTIWAAPCIIDLELNPPMTIDRSEDEKYEISSLQITYFPERMQKLDTCKQIIFSIFGYIASNLLIGNLVLLFGGIVAILSERNFVGLKDLVMHNCISLLSLIFGLIEPIFYKSNSYGLVMFAKFMPSCMSSLLLTDSVYLFTNFHLDKPNGSSYSFFNTNLRVVVFRKV